jgi:hypothetical protein
VANALRYVSTACTPPTPDCSIPAQQPADGPCRCDYEWAVGVEA